MKNEMMFGYLIHLSKHMWDDENTPPRGWYQAKRFTENNDCDIEVWDRVVSFLGERKYNMLMIDVGDGIKYESHPEISAPDAWDKDFLRRKLREMRALGIEPIPKLNFSCCHHTWLKEYRRMVSTPTYYKVCADVIREVCEVFDNPGFIHFGLDEENAGNQRYRDSVHIRNGELWWHDAYFYFKEAEKYGARPWVWADYAWDKADIYVNKMPKSVLQSNWYYELFTDFAPENHASKEIGTYELLDKHGFEQVPCCSCWGRAGAYNVLQTVAHGKEKLNPELLRGFMIAPWWFTNTMSEYQLKNDAHVLYTARQQYYPETLK